MSVEDEVLRNLKGQAVGPATVGDLGLPDPFLRRVVDRVIRASFEERYRIVVREGGEPRPTASAPEGMAVGFRVVERTEPAWDGPGEGRPEVRGYRAGCGWPVRLAGAESVAAMVAKRLAADGLLATALGAIEAIGAERFREAGEAELAVLRGVGLPVDLLAHFAEGGGSAESVVRALAAMVGKPGARKELAGRPMRFQPTRPGFRACSEAGEGRIGMIRVQITGGTHWGGHGAGGGLDVVRGLLAALPEAECVGSVEAGHLEPFMRTAGAWGTANPGRVRVVPQALPVSQWAQDDGKAGLDAEGRWVTLAPRYASRGEDGSILIPGDTAAAEGLSAAGLDVARSPLLFQGGNLLAARDPASGALVLLIGEAEVYRNVALGLTAAQAEEALRLEMGADRSVVLPAVSFHIDYEVSLAARGGRLVALVNDTGAGAAAILACGLSALSAGGAMGKDEAGVLAAEARAGRWAAAVGAAGAALGPLAAGPGCFPQRVAEWFSAGGALEAGVANFQRFLLALDVLTASLLTPARMPEDPHARAYLRSFARREADRRVLHRKLEAMGCRLAKVPSLGEGERGLNAVNGLHDGMRYLMPACGGLYEEVDRAAAAAIMAGLGPGTEVVPVVCGESQRRAGAVRCAASAYTRPGCFVRVFTGLGGRFFRSGENFSGGNPGLW